MKKILLLSALVSLSMAASAQGISVTIQGKPVQNGATVTTYCLESQDFTQNMPDGSVLEWTESRLDPQIMATAPDGEYKITVTNTSTGNPIITPEGVKLETILFCWPSGCKYITSGNSDYQEGNLFEDEPSALLIDTQSWKGDITEMFTLSCKVEIESKDNSTAKFTFNVNMTNDPSASVKGIESDYSNYPVEYYDLTGRKITNPIPGKIVIEKRGPKAYKKIFK